MQLANFTSVLEKKPCLNYVFLEVTPLRLYSTFYPGLGGQQNFAAPAPAHDTNTPKQPYLIQLFFRNCFTSKNSHSTQVKNVFFLCKYEKVSRATDVGLPVCV